jgi:hypothetical protein
MFSFRRDKMGFFATLVLLTIVGGTLISTLVLLVVGIAQGNWKEHLLSVKWILGSAWVLCIVTVLTRVHVFGWQLRRAQRQEEARQAEEAKESSKPPSSS